MKKVLIADDDPLMVKILEHNLVKEGFLTSSLYEGSLVEVTAESMLPDVLILDYLLPGKNGLEIIQDFKKNPKIQNIPIIVVTVHGKDSLQKNLIDAGAIEVFYKPFSPNALIKKINNII